jgi:alpha-amylase/alpha-mannosidase (GH57 family)
MPPAAQEDKMAKPNQKYVCVHGHFYQPPRENPWLEAVEIQDSASPYHDWNERITAECYASNAASRILDGEQRVMDITSNYAKMSFNFGPTVLSWMQLAAPEVYQSILDADRQSMEWRSGHGAAIAQVYNHIIMPLANTRDKRTQIIWGIKDFESRFQRFPEGMWLAETAVDLETLDLLAEQGIKFTILAPHQAARFRKIGDKEWTEESIDPTRAYLCQLESKRSITIFFYDGPISQAVAFENLLSSGEALAGRLLGGLSDERDWPQLLHIATDGETYGHHQKFGDMALAAAFNQIESNDLARITNYGEYLELCPPTYEAQINERTSWSCAHGVERWNSDCGCNSGGYPQWNQQWRTPLRASLDFLRDRLAAGFTKTGGQFFKDPWQARDAYIEVMLNREMEQAEKFLAEHASRELSADEKVTALKLLEMQRHALLMYTSCGWFFDELSGLETVQVIDYAGRALQLSAGIVEQGVEKAFLDRLKEAKSNVPENQDGAWIYQHFVLPTRLDLVKVGAHYAFSSLFEEYQEHSQIYCYAVAKEDYTKIATEEASIAMGRIHVASEITEESECLIFCVVRLGSHDFKGGVASRCEAEAYAAMKEEMSASFDKGLYTELVTLMDKHFGTHSYSLANLFRDEQRKILNIIIDKNLEESVSSYQSMFEHSRTLMEFVQDTGMPAPPIMLVAAQPALSAALKQALTQEEIDAEAVQRTIAQARKWRVALDSPETEYFLRRHAEKLMRAFAQDPSDLKLLAGIQKFMDLKNEVPITVVLWQVQNDYYALAKTTYRDYLAKSRQGDEGAGIWLDAFRKLGETFHINLGAVLPEE